ncbi:MAG: hypothetical protein HY562_04265 [Ignavibacteriales bacterium]|nr:hypothetical protein [Ignavibacteriales bacterium]
MAKSKYILHQCAYCHKQTKMELVGGMQNEGASEPPQKVWYRCTRCKHSALLDAVTVQKEKNGNVVKIDRSECLEYSKEKVYALGQSIYHAGLDDVGKVIKKDKTSNGVHSITVSFEKLGERKLIENVPVDTTAELAAS